MLHKQDKVRHIRTWTKTENADFLNHISKNVSGNVTVANNKTLSAISKDFSIDELYKFLMTKSNKSAPGTDGITYSMVKALPDKSIDKLLEALNKCFQKCEIK